MGVIAGRSDMVLYLNGKAFHIEIKTEQGYHSAAQLEWKNKIESHGFKYFTVKNLEQFQELIKYIHTL